MPKTKISEFSATPGNNTDIDGINIAEGCAPSGINDAIRELMSQLKDFQAGTAGDSFNGPVGTTTAAAGAFTTLSASGAVTLSGGTANGVPYLNGSKVLTTGSALTFDGTNLGFGGTGQRITGDFSNATVANRVMFQTSTANTFALIGAIPNGTGNISGFTAFNNSDPTNSSVADVRATSTDISFRANISGTGTYLPMTFYTGGSERMRLDTSGNVGIGTSSPGYSLEINRAGGGFRVRDAAAGNDVVIQTAAGPISLIGSTANTAIGFTTNNTERARIDSSGNVGIGTSSPTSRLHVVGAASTTAAQLRGNSGANIVVDFSGGGNNFHDASNHIFRSVDGASERARIDSSGNLLVGTTSALGIGITLSGGGTQIVNNFNADYTVASFRINGTQRGFITTTSSGTTFSTSSDYRLKQDIAPMTGALVKVAALKPCTYKWKETGIAGEGFIAHELAEVCPAAVTGEKDAVDAEGNPVYQGIDTSFLVATLTAAIQEQQAIIEQLKADVAALKGN